MRVIGLTGGMGAGKSTVARLLAERGATVIDVDAVGRDVIAPGGPAEAAVRDRFGTTDRTELARIVFGDPAALADLTAVSHPAINAVLAARLEELARAGDVAVVVLDMAVLTESSLGRPGQAGRGYDTVVVVEAPVGTRLARLAALGIREGAARARMAAQATDEQRRAIADHVIANDGDVAALRRAADELWNLVSQ